MKGQIIGNSLFKVNDTGKLCDVGITPHEKAVIEEWRRNSNKIGHYCERHGDARRDEALKVLNSLRVTQRSAR